MILESLHVRGALGTVRTEMFDGREHLIIPAVALIGNSVIHAVNAPHAEKIPVETLVKAANSFNGRPVVYGHPVRDGMQISANEPGVFDSHGIGTIFNSRMDGAKLLMDCYVDPVKAEALGGKEFVDGLRNGKMNEISVGAMVTTDAVNGTLNGKSYKGQWRETFGDHVAAIHSGGLGACSIANGCGLGRAATVHLVTAEGYRMLDDSERSDNDRRTLVQAAVQKQFGTKASASMPYPGNVYVRDLVGDSAIIEMPTGLFSVPFTIDDKNVVTLGKAVPVETKYATLQKKSIVDRARTLGVTSVLGVLGGPGSGPHKVGDRVSIKSKGRIDHGRTGKITAIVGRDHYVSTKEGHSVGVYDARQLFNQENRKLRGAESSDFELGSSVQVISTGITGTVSSVSGDEITVESESGDELGPFGEDELKTLGALPDKSQVEKLTSGGSMADCATCGGTGKIRAGKVTCPDCKGMKAASRSLRQRLEALFKPIITTLAEGDPPVDPEDTAELVSYEAMQELIGQAQASLTSGAAQVQELIDSEANPEDDEDLEDARLEALISMCMQLYGTINGIVKIATAQLSDDDSIPPMQSYMAHLVGKEISAKNMAAIQGAHDNAHDLHKNLTDLGAECNGMKLLSADGKSSGAESDVDSKGEETMDKTQRAAAITALVGSKCGCYKDAKATLETLSDGGLEGTQMLVEAGIRGLAFSKADAEKVITDHATATDALKAHADGLKAKADKKKEDAADGGKDDAEEVKAAAARLVAAKAAGFETVEAHEQGQFYAKNPEIKALVDRQKAQDTARKTELVKALQGGPLTDKQLEAKPLAELETLAAFAKVDKPDFSGRGLAVNVDASDVYANPPNPYLKALEARKARVQ